MKLLLCEDDATTLEFIKKGLLEEGHTVECVSDGREALSMCLYNEFEVIILDRMIPGMDGLSVLKSLRAANNTTPAIFLTAMADVDDRVLFVLQSYIKLNQWILKQYWRRPSYPLNVTIKHIISPKGTPRE